MASGSQQLTSNLIRAWQVRAARLAPDSRHTDILSALLVAGQLFDEAPHFQRTVVFIYSDMRQATATLNLEGRSRIPAGAALAEAGRNLAAPALKDVQAYCMGVDAAARDASDWERLHDFWARYFASVGAHLRLYTILRNLPSGTLAP